MSVSAKTRGFTVRRALIDDLDQAREVIRLVLERDLCGYDPQVHWDLERLRETYLESPRYALIVAVDDTSQQVVGTTAVRPGGPKSPPHPPWLAERYNSDRVAQLFRVYISPEHRRRGIARSLVDAARQFIADEGSYEVIYLHTNPASHGAEAFWRSMPTTEIYDGRTGDGPSQAVHFELAFPKAGPRKS